MDDTLGRYFNDETTDALRVTGEADLGYDLNADLAFTPKLYWAYPDNGDSIDYSERFLVSPEVLEAHGYKKQELSMFEIVVDIRATSVEEASRVVFDALSETALDFEGTRALGYSKGGLL